MSFLKNILLKYLYGEFLPYFLDAVVKYYMKIKNNILNTINYYEKSASILIDTYETADMLGLHTFLFKHLKSEAKIMDIGFGSGRDLAFLKQQGFDIWGIDPSQKFVEHVQERFSSIPHHFSQGALPKLLILKDLLHSFDCIILIAVWMHLPKETYVNSIRSLCKLLKPNGKIILSYSITPRTAETERYFENIDRLLLKELFKKEGCTKIDEIMNQDGLREREITWITEAYSYDQF